MALVLVDVGFPQESPAAHSFPPALQKSPIPFGAAQAPTPGPPRFKKHCVPVKAWQSTSAVHPGKQASAFDACTHGFALPR
jgi:hypothetical protein